MILVVVSRWSTVIDITHMTHCEPILVRISRVFDLFRVNKLGSDMKTPHFYFDLKKGMNY